MPPNGGTQSPTPRGNSAQSSRAGKAQAPSPDRKSSPTPRSAWTKCASLPPAVPAEADSHASQPNCPDLAEWALQAQSNLSHVRAMRQEAQARLSKGLQSASVATVSDAHILGSAHNYTIIQDKLKRRVAATENISMTVTERIEGTEQMIQKIQQHMAEMNRFSGLLYASLSVAEKRLEMRAGRPPSELVRDGFQEALEKEKAALIRGRSQLADTVEEGKQILACLEEVNAELSKDRHVLPQDRSNRPQELIARARGFEQEAARFCSDIGTAARVKEAVDRDADRASARTYSAMKKRVGELLEVRRQLESEMEETSGTLAEAQWHFERTSKQLKHLAAKPEQASGEHASFVDSMRHIFMSPLMTRLRAKIKGSSYIGHEGRKLDTLFKRFDKDGSGSLDEDEVRKALRRTLRIPPSAVSDAEISNLCAILDADKSGDISIDELVAFLGADQDVEALTAQNVSAHGIIETLTGALQELQADLRLKTAAWKIDEACTRVTPIKGLELDAPPSHYRAGALSARGSRPPGVRAARPISLETQEKLRSKIKAAAYTGHSGRQLEILFSRFDKDGTGELEDDELRKALRRTLRIAPSQITDQEITSLCGLLDSDRSGTVSIAEIVDFVGKEPEISKRTGKSLTGGLLEPIRSEELEPQPKVEPKPPPKPRKPGKPLHPEAIEKLKFKMKSAAYTGHAGRQLEVVFSRFDKDGSGGLDDDEVRRALRRTLRIPQKTVSDQEIASLCALLDADNDGFVSIKELIEFIGADPEVSRRTGKPTGQQKLAPMSPSPTPTEPKQYDLQNLQ